MQQTILITGGAGYVGEMLVYQFARREDVEKIIVLDKEPKSDSFPLGEKIIYIQDNLANNSWTEKLKDYKIDVVIHTAWQIRVLYGEKGYAKTWHWNIDGSNNLFDFVFQNNISKLIHFSTVASYGSFKTNTANHFFKEIDPLRHSSYIYAEEKKIAEENLQRKFIEAVNNCQNDLGKIPDIVILRPVAISGPRGRDDKIRFGLQSNLQGKIKGGFLFSIIKLLTTFVPATSKWVRQFIHEDDVVKIVEKLVFQEKLISKYDIFNICPAGDLVLPSDMAKAVGKKIIWVWPFMVRIVFTFFWHISRGRIPTCPGVWRGYSYPIVVDGSKITEKYNFQYQYSSQQAFTTNQGYYQREI